MLRFVLALVLCIAPLFEANAQGGMMPGPGTPHTTASSYVGPCDIVSGPTVWYGLRACSAAYAAAGGKAIQVANNAAATHDIVILTNGNLDTATAVTFAGTPVTASCTLAGTTATCTGISGSVGLTYVVQGAGITQPCTVAVIFSGATATVSNPGSGASCGTVVSPVATTFTPPLTVSLIYDQSGNGNNASPGSTQQAQLLPNCLGSGQTLPCLYFPTSGVPGVYTATLSSTAFTTTTQTFVANRTGNLGSFGGVVDLGTQAVASGFGMTANTAFMFAGTVITASATDGTWHDAQAVYNGASSILNVDGSNAGSVNPGTVSTGQTAIKWGDDTTNNQFIGYSTEIGSWPSVFNSTQYGNMHTNTATYWSVP